MSEFLQQLLNGINLGAIYALIALGYTMVYGVLRFINFAHSDVFMVGAFVGYYAGQKWGFPTGSIGGGLLVLVTAMATCAALGVTIERLAYKPLRGRSTLTVLITAIGVSLLIQNVAQHSRIGFGPNPKSFQFDGPNGTRHGLFPETPITLSNLTVSSNQVIILAVTLALLASLWWIVHRTKIGTAMRAVSFNATAAALVGINNNAVISFTFALGSALAGAGGVLYAMNYPSIDPLMGTLPGLKAFVAAVLGGIGNLPGAALGGLVIGMIETFVKGSPFSTYTDAIAFAILILILLFRPAGLLGTLRTEKV
jgi:branched-chain amino acid transport system permease protein